MKSICDLSHLKHTEIDAIRLSVDNITYPVPDISAKPIRPYVASALGNHCKEMSPLPG